jgi:hypothetical protein
MKMLTARWAAVAMSTVMVVAVPAARASLLYRLTFDNDGQPGGNANSNYTASADDFIDMHQGLTRYGTNPIPQIVASTGPQGGKAMVTTGAGWTDPGPGYTSDNTNSKAYTVFSFGGLTLEAIAKADSWSPSGWWWGSPGMVNCRNGLVLGFSGSAGNSPDLFFTVDPDTLTYTSPTPLANGAWHHYAGVWTRNADGTKKMEIFVDNVSVTSKVTTASPTAIPSAPWGFAAEGDAVPPRSRSWYGTMDAAAVSDEALSPGRFVLQQTFTFPDVYSENFESGFTNGATGSFDGNGAAVPGRWAMRAPANWQVMDLGAPRYKTLAFTNGAFNSTWWPIGAQVPFRLRQDRPITIDLSARVQVSVAGSTIWQGWLYFADRDLNGYGVRLVRNGNGGDQKYYAKIIKYCGSTSALGSGVVANWTDSEGFDTTNSYALVGTASDGFVRMHVRLTQMADGQPITVKLWHAESGVADTSVANPDQTWVDDGTAAGSILNLRSLNWVGVNAEEDSNKGNAPAAGVWFDDISVQSVPTYYGTVLSIQ